MKITIPEPCDQRWDEMTPKGMNRHCQMCQKEIIDFSHYSDAALVKYIEANEGRICGRFMSDQLNRELVYQAPKKSVLSFISQKWLAFWLFATAPVHFLKAQTKVEFTVSQLNPIDTTKNKISGKIEISHPSSFQDYEISLFELNLKTKPDLNGFFSFEFEDASFGVYTLHVNKYGREEISQMIENVPINSNVIVHFVSNEDQLYTGGIEVSRNEVEKKRIFQRRRKTRN